MAPRRRLPFRHERAQFRTWTSPPAAPSRRCPPDSLRQPEAAAPGCCPQRELWARGPRGKVAGPRTPLECHPGPGSENGYVTHKSGSPSGRDGGLVEEDVDGGRKSTCPERGRGSMEQGKKPRS